jgi:Ethanolamine utilization protein EutJ (predicted chaperonin)
MSCTCKILNTEATVGSTFILQLVLKDDEGTVIDITGYRVAMAAKSKGGTTLFTADSEGEGAKITLDAETGATITVLVPEDTAPQAAEYDVLISKNEVITPIIRGTINLLPQITDLTP